VGKKMLENGEEKEENQEEKSEEIIEKIKSLSNLSFWESNGNYEIKREIKNEKIKAILEVRFLEGEDTNYLWIEYIIIKIRNEEMKIDLTIYDYDNYDMDINEIKLGYKSENSELLYFKGFEDVYSIFEDMTEFIKEKVEEFVKLHENEIPESLMQKIQNLLNQI
jgi:hypothetical protein